jgi:hypothetical protein
MKKLLVASAIVLISTSALAEEQWWSQNWRRSNCDVRDRCIYHEEQEVKYVYVQERKQHKKKKHHRRYDRDDGYQRHNKGDFQGGSRQRDNYKYGDRREHCKETLRVVGTQHLTVEGARKSADDAWAGTVRFHYGEKYMTLDRAYRIKYTCSRSSIAEAGIATLGQILTRCEIQAQPCEAETQ